MLPGKRELSKCSKRPSSLKRRNRDPLRRCGSGGRGSRNSSTGQRRSKNSPLVLRLGNIMDECCSPRLRILSNGRRSSTLPGNDRSGSGCTTASSGPTNRFWMMPHSDHLQRPLNIESGASNISPAGWAMAARFDYPQAEEIQDCFSRHGVRYLFIGKAGAILLGFPDTTKTLTFLSIRQSKMPLP